MNCVLQTHARTRMYISSYCCTGCADLIDQRIANYLRYKGKIIKETFFTKFSESQ